MKAIFKKTIDVLVSAITSALLSIVFSTIYFFAFIFLFPSSAWPENSFGAGILLLEAVMIPMAFFAILGTSTGSIVAMFHSLIQTRKKLMLLSLLVWFISLFFILELYPLNPLNLYRPPFLVMLSALALLETMLVSSFTNWLINFSFR